MSKYRNEGPISVTSGEALVADRLCLLTSSTAKYADAGEVPVGLSTEPVASSVKTSLRLLRSSIEPVTASKAISASADLYVTTDGKVTDAAIGPQIGIAIESASGNGAIFPALIWSIAGASPVVSDLGQIIYKDDFYTYDNTATVGGYAEVSDGGAIAPTDANGGVLSIATDVNAQDESYVSSLHKVFKFQTDKNGFFEARVKLTEANTNDANIIIGLSDTVSANFLQDAGAGPAASYDGAVFFKLFDELLWNFEVSNAGTQDTELSVGTFTSATWHKLGFRYEFKDGVTATITPYVDGVAGTAVTMLIAGLEEMHLVAGLKAGGANAETLLVDYIYYTQDR